MELTLDNPADATSPFADRFAHVARINGTGGALLILAGQVAVDSSGAVVAPGDVTTQSEVIFTQIETLLAAHGAALTDVAHIRTYLTNLDDLRGYATVRQRYFSETRPASTTVEVNRLFLDGAVLEVEVTAIVS